MEDSTPFWRTFSLKTRKLVWGKSRGESHEAPEQLPSRPTRRRERRRPPSLNFFFGMSLYGPLLDGLGRPEGLRAPERDGVTIGPPTSSPSLSLRGDKAAIYASSPPRSPVCIAINVRRGHNQEKKKEKKVFRGRLCVYALCAFLNLYVFWQGD